MSLAANHFPRRPECGLPIRSPARSAKLVRRTCTRQGIYVGVVELASMEHVRQPASRCGEDVRFDSQSARVTHPPRTAHRAVAGGCADDELRCELHLLVDM